MRLAVVTTLALCLMAPTVGSAQSAAAASACGSSETARQCFRRALDATARALKTERTRTAPKPSDALALLRDACMRGESESCFLAGNLAAAPDSADDDVAILANVRAAARLWHRGCYETSPASGAACNSLGDAIANWLDREQRTDSSGTAYERGCALKFITACGAVGRIVYNDPMFGPDHEERAREIASKSCFPPGGGGSPRGCDRFAVILSDRLDTLSAAERALPANRVLMDSTMRAVHKACVAENWNACNNEAAFYAAGYGRTPKADSIAHAIYSRACTSETRVRTPDGQELTLGNGYACKNLGQAAQPDTSLALKYFERGCFLFEANACALWSYYAYSSRKVTPVYLTLLRAVTTCYESDAYACGIAGWLYSQPDFKDADQERRFHERGCDLGRAWSCYRLADLFTDASRRIKYYRRACALTEGEATACIELASLLRKQDVPGASPLYYERRACDLRSASGCWDYARSIEAEDPVTAGTTRARACALDADYCKRKW